jgi:hypothetical protein
VARNRYDGFIAGTAFGLQMFHLCALHSTSLRIPSQDYYWIERRYGTGTFE